jgi:hypothetical protein
MVSLSGSLGLPLELVAFVISWSSAFDVPHACSFLMRFGDLGDSGIGSVATFESRDGPLDETRKPSSASVPAVGGPCQVFDREVFRKGL